MTKTIDMLRKYMDGYSLTSRHNGRSAVTQVLDHIKEGLNRLQQQVSLSAQTDDADKEKREKQRNERDTETT